MHTNSQLTARRTALRKPALAVLGLAALLTGPFADAVRPDDERSYYVFETFQTCALDMSPDGTALVAANTPNNSIEVFRIGEDGGLQRSATVKVGLEPSCVKWRSATEIWVVNHVSDSLSVVEVDTGDTPRVRRTIKVGDQPYSIAFGGPDGRYAFIPTKRRDLLERTWDNVTGALDVWVLDTQALDGGEPVAILNFFAEAAAEIVAGRGPNADRLYVMPLRSGNRSTIAPATVLGGDLPEPLTNVFGDPAPEVGLVAKQDDAGVWRDGAGRDISRYIDVDVTDNDLCTIDAGEGLPAAGACVEGVGTILYGAAVGPDGTVYVANTDADNARRFEGKGEFAGSTVSGRHHLNFISTVAPDGTLTRTWLNSHLDFEAAEYSAADRATSLALVTDLAISDDGETLYGAAFGSSKIALFDTDALKDGSYTPDPANHVEVSGGGPNSLVFDGARKRLYAITRFNNSIVTIDLEAKQEIDSIPMYNPEPPHVVAGRPVMYDARATSGPGNSACASCHVFGDTDDLSWDLGDPDLPIEPNFNLFVLREPDVDIDFHPMKGPMFTQTLKGMRHHGPMHWRADRNGAADGADPLDEKEAFKQFIGAFEGVLAREEPVSDAQMDAFADFALELMLEPNYYQPVDGQLSLAQERGRQLYFEFPSSIKTGFACNDCHTLDPALGNFGTGGLSATRERRPDSPTLKVATIQLVPDKLSAPETIPFPNPVGTNYRGFFMNHEGSTFTLFAFLRSEQFRFPREDQDRQALIQFLLATPRSLENTVGQQVMFDASSTFADRRFLNTLETRALESEPVSVCDLTASGVVNGEQRGFVMIRRGRYLSDRLLEGLYTTAELVEIARQPGQQLTFLCVPPGSGVRIGIDADEDGFYDRDELDAGSDPLDPGSVPAA